MTSAYDSAESIATFPRKSDLDDEQLQVMLASLLYLQEREASVDQPRVYHSYRENLSVKLVKIRHQCRETCCLTGCCGGLDIFVPNQICGFQGHFWAVSVASGSWANLDILEITGRVSWRASCLKQNTCLIKIVGKNVSHCQTTPYLIHWREEKTKPTHFDAFFVSPNCFFFFFGTTGSVELNMTFFDIFNSVERPIFP